MTRESLHPIATWTGRLALVVVAAGWIAFFRPMALGGPVDYLVIRGDSMVPTYLTGDLVIVQAGARYMPGDVVAYRVPAGELGAGRIVIHRIVGRADGAAGSDSATGSSVPAPDTPFILKGDNNPTPDPWQPRASDIVGRAWIAVPAVGRVLALLHQPAVLAAGAVAVLVMGWVLRGPRSTDGPPDRRAGQPSRAAGTLTAWLGSFLHPRPRAPIASSSSGADSAG